MLQKIICSPNWSMAAWLYFLVIFCQFPFMRAVTDSGDSNGLLVLKNLWSNTPSNWVKNDPCGRNWDGISCNNESRVTAIKLSGLNLKGFLPTDMPSLPELETLDLSNNPSLTGTLPENIGILTNLKSLVLVGCNFYGPIPEAIGSLSKLKNLFLNSNRFNGSIPHSVGKLSNMVWFDVTDNQLTGEIPVSNATTSGLDKLTKAKHFHLGRNQLSGQVPSSLFSSSLKSLIHVVFDHNRLSGAIPDTLGEVENLEVIRMDKNQFNSSIPQSLSKLVNLTELFLGNNLLTGSLPDLTNLTSLQYIDLSNNSFSASDMPSWFTIFQNLTTLKMENTSIQGSVLAALFDLPKLQTVVLSNNNLNATLEISTGHSEDLVLIDLQNNSIMEVNNSAYNKTLLLDGNPVCTNQKVCNSEGKNFQLFIPESNCSSSSCSSNKLRSPSDCKCRRAYIGHIIFRSYSFSDLNKTTYFEALKKSIMEYVVNTSLPVESFSLVRVTMDSFSYLNMTVAFFPPSGNKKFNVTGITNIGNDLNDHKFTAPANFYGPFYYRDQPYDFSNGKTMLAVILGAVISSVLLVLLVLIGLYALRQRRIAQIASRKNNPFASWDPNQGGGDIPQIKESRWYSFEDMRSITENFSEENEIGRGGYGKVYKGTLPGGQVVAIKRAQQGSLQGALEFKTEIELLSRVHHKNIVNLVGFCFDHGEQMLIYEYIKGGTLNTVISGKMGFRLDWTQRLKVALGAARGIAYLHEFADPPIIHRDIKSTNILIDERLNAKVADFGLSRLLNHEEKDHATTEVKGTLGYLDPEYYSTQILTEKSDVYSFGVVMLELLTAQKPIEKGKHIVRAVREEMSDPSGIHTLVDPAIDSDLSMVGLREYLYLSLRCVEEYGAGRPSMNEIVKEIESIMDSGGMDLESRTTSSMASFGVTSAAGGSTYTSSDPAFTSVTGLSSTGSTPLLR
ncbi:hypothetical protein V2J09_019552 [Rumex salicifolius]